MATHNSRLNDALTRSRSEHSSTRVGAIPDLGLLIAEPEARARLVEMLDDDIVTMEIDAADVLVRYGGDSGLARVLDVLGRRRDDPDADYIAYRLYELDASGEKPVIDIAESMRELLSDNALVGLEDLLVLRFPETPRPNGAGLKGWSAGGGEGSASTMSSRPPTIGSIRM
ncbi:hypothetical protein [Nocardia sp. NPDC058705]|uniref:hypothetical protein n=1 Tax=Nocardia sp. NPDC058705 TaxID=3346609 RepID=UPI0036C258B0